MFLTHEQICDLTGKKFKTAQKDALDKMGIEYISRPDGSPAVLIAHINKRLDGALFSETAKSKPQPKFNYCK